LREKVFYFPLKSKWMGDSKVWVGKGRKSEMGEYPPSRGSTRFLSSARNKGER